MPTKIHKNTFEGGLNKDLDPKSLPYNQYSDAVSLTLTQDGQNASATPIKGTSEIETLVSNTLFSLKSDIHILGMIQARLLVNGVEKEGIMVCVYNYGASPSNNLQIFAYDIAGDAKYLVYQASVANADMDDDVFGDIVIFREAGEDFLYYTDYTTDLKKIPCNTKGISPNNVTPIYSDEEVYLIRAGFRGTVSDIDVNHGNGGDLVCGTYQFAYRLFNSGTNRYTKWSLLTNPIFVGMDGTAANIQAYGGVGFVSNANIDLTLQLQQDYTINSLYDYYQLVVIENVNGTKEGTLTAKVLKPEVITDFNFPTVPATTVYSYNTNAVAEELITVDELTIDDAAIKTFKTLAIKNNRIIGGNIKYHGLEYDNNEPAVANTTTPVIQTLTGVQAYSDYQNSSKYAGHFRDELYRYYISYFDKFGNYSRPKLLDFSSVTENRALGNKDFRFPDRDHANFGPLINSTGNIQAMGLQLQGVTNHPSWSKGFVILRAPRKKKIQFQTPAIPSQIVMPATAKGGYPDQRMNRDGVELEILNVEAANPDGSFVPKNYLQVLPKNMVRQGDIEGVVQQGAIYYLNESLNVQPIFHSDPSNTGVPQKTLVWTSNLLANRIVVYKYPSDITTETPELWYTTSTMFIAATAPGIIVQIYEATAGTNDFSAVYPNTPSATRGEGTGYDTENTPFPTFNVATTDYLIYIKDHPSYLT